ncbi:TetR/AcrR family transcriptional regulator [Alkalicoccobacillus porphyridii]|uniref:TetR/AcrR family transcriptional regulator n=1 Tax=Alkalicoccobacillus porphyridii TaxID=2597270 RepID=A0A553ZWY5_9BACI|nr:TetR/AcrR family transcriptional regulator [Alkalicoccobacillus porphyridii]TSB45978.1 TetR/AcrR family transcriptional regulator [Alkalicoccobacillus porphyridii]
MTSRKKEKYNQILNAAVHVFAENGYHKSQVSKIAKAANVADGTIYLYFKNKEDILISLFREKLGELVGKFHTSLEHISNAEEAIHSICHIHFSELEANPAFAYVTQIELRQSNMEMRVEIGQAVKPYIQLLENTIVKGIEAGQFRKELDPKLIRLLLFGAMDEVVTSWLISGQKYSLSEQVDPTVEFFLKGLRAD